jgi:hypothetical protein
MQSKIIKIKFKNFMIKEMFLRKASMLPAKECRSVEHSLKITTIHQQYVYFLVYSGAIYIL